ncbi:outer membrane beta-barrel protein [Candidatus Margulisiibacteriota bacterium]
MKKIALFLVFLIFSLSPISAKPTPITLKTGINYTTSTYSAMNNYGQGFHIGAGTVIPIIDKINIHADALYTFKKAKGKYSVSSWDEITLTLATSYIEIPVIINYTLSEDFSFYGGAYIGYLLSAAQKISNVPAVSIVRAGTINVKDSTENTDYGIILGGAYTNSGWAFSGHYSLGLKDIMQGKDLAQKDIEGKLNSLTVSISYSFLVDFKKRG